MSSIRRWMFVVCKRAASCCGIILWMTNLLCVGANELPLFVIPPMTTAPIIDGKIDGANWPKCEWSMANLLSGFTTVGEVPVPSAYLEYIHIGYDESALYLAFRVYNQDGTQLHSEARERDTTAWMDDSFEIHMAVGETPSEGTYQFVVNADNVIWDGINDPAGRDPDTTWNPEWQHKTRRRADGWDAEIAIPWKVLKIDSPREGQALRVNFGHNYSIPGQQTLEVASWGPTEDEKGEKVPYCSLLVMPKAILGGNGPAVGVQVTEENGAPIARLRLVNPSRKNVQIKYSIDKSWNDYHPAVEGNQWASPQLPVKLDDDGTGKMLVQAARLDDQAIFRQMVRFRSRYGSNLTLRKYFPGNYLTLGSEIPLPKGTTLSVAINNDKGQPVPTNIVRIGASDSELARIDIQSWPEQVPYTVTASLLDTNGMSMGKRVFTLTKPKLPAWLGTRVGLTDDPLPPYTAIRVAGSRFQFLQTDYSFANRGLPVQIKANGQDILTAPVSLVLTEEGRAIEVLTAPIEKTLQKPNRVEWKTSQDIGSLSFSLKGWMEEDGFVWCELKVMPKKPARVDSLELKFPLRRDCVKYVGATRPIETMEQCAFALDDKGWKADQFYTTLNLLNEDRGLTVMSAEPKEWSNRDHSRQRIEATKDTAQLIFAFVDQPTTLDKPRTFEFGFEAMPAKPLNIKNGAMRAIHNIDYGHEVVSCALTPGTLEYPLEGNLDPEKGTLEAWVYADFDATYEHGNPEMRWYLNQKLFQVLTTDGSAALAWNADYHRWRLIRSFAGKSDDCLASDEQKWPKPAWHHVAVTWGDKLKLYSDGKLLMEKELSKLLPSTNVTETLKGGKLIFGKQRIADRSEYRVGGIRISSRSLSPEQFALDGKFIKTGDTLLLQEFSNQPSGAALALPAAGKAGELRGTAKIVSEKGITGLIFSPLPDLSILEYVASLGAKSVIFHSGWTDDFGAPRTEHTLALKALVKACHQNGMKILLYLGYGIGAFMPESQLYEDYWIRMPVCIYAADGRQYFRAWCNNAGWNTDFILDGMSKVLQDFDADGFFLDGAINSYYCTNPHHGCGWKDAWSNLQPSMALLANRAFAKRLYAIAKQHRPDAYLDLHSSSALSAWTCALSDRCWSGEQFFRHPKPPALAEMAAQYMSTAYGTSIDFIWGEYAHSKGLTFEQQMAFPLQFNGEPRSWIYRRETSIPPIVDLWRIKDAFNVDEAEWIPFGKAAGLLACNGGNTYASMYLVRGKRALIVLSNLQDKPAEVTLNVNLSKLGLKGAFKDARTNTPLDAKSGEIHLPCNAYDWKLIWVE